MSHGAIVPHRLSKASGRRHSLQAEATLRLEESTICHRCLDAERTFEVFRPVCVLASRYFSIARTPGIPFPLSSLYL